MIFGWPIEILAVIVLLFAAIGLYFGVIYSSFKKYENAEKDSGNVIMELEPSKRTLMLRRVEYILAFVLMIILELMDYIRNEVIRTDVWIIIIALIAGYCLSNKPQKLCENGILVNYGLFSWDSIKEIMPVDENDDKIKIKLHKRIRGAKKIVLYSKPEAIMNVVHIIERKINKSFI